MKVKGMSVLICNMHSKSRKNCGGFTLIELLLYLSLCVIMLAVLGGIGINVLSSRVKAHAYEEMHYNAQFLTEKITSVIASASAINQPEANATSSTLSLVMDDPSKNPTVIDSIDGSVRIQEGTDPAMILSGDGVVVSTLQFTHSITGSASPLVRVELYLDSYNASGRDIYDASSVFFTTASLHYIP